MIFSFPANGFMITHLIFPVFTHAQFQILPHYLY